jgi:hypothetical protein
VSIVGLVVASVGGAPAALAAAAPVPTFFDPVEIHSVGTESVATAIGDVTGDGRPDVLLTTCGRNDANSNKVFVFAQDAAGRLGEPVAYGTRLTPFDYECAMAVFDEDGDGRLDVALGTLAGVEILRQNAAGTLTSRGVLAGSPPAGQIVAADVDADGDTDLVTSLPAITGEPEAGIRLLTRAADGTYTPSRFATEQTLGVAVGDVDGDAYAEIAGWDNRSLYVYDHSEAGWAKRVLPESSVGANGVDIADVTNDGRADVIATRGGNLTPHVAIYPQTATGTLGKSVGYLTTDIPEAVRATDVTHDGRADIVIVHGGWQTLSTLVQINGMAPAIEEPLPYASSYNPQALAIGDVSGDGRPDVAIADYNHGLLILRNAIPL